MLRMVSLKNLGSLVAISAAATAVGASSICASSAARRRYAGDAVVDARRLVGRHRPRVRTRAQHGERAHARRCLQRNFDDARQGRESYELPHWFLHPVHVHIRLSELVTWTCGGNISIKAPRKVMSRANDVGCFATVPSADYAPLFCDSECKNPRGIVHKTACGGSSSVSALTDCDMRIERRCSYEIIKFNDSVRTRQLVLGLGQ